MSSSLPSMPLQCWQILRWSWIPRIFFRNNPVELLQHIFSNLPLPSHFRLALSSTSKGLYAFFSSVLRAKELMVDLTRHKPASALTAAQVTRYLGRDEWFANQGWFEFEKQWYRQCRDSTDYIPIWSGLPQWPLTLQIASRSAEEDRDWKDIETEASVYPRTAMTVEIYTELRAVTCWSRWGAGNWWNYADKHVQSLSINWKLYSV